VAATVGADAASSFSAANNASSFRLTIKHLADTEPSTFSSQQFAQETFVNSSETVWHRFLLASYSENIGHVQTQLPNNNNDV